MGVIGNTFSRTFRKWSDPAYYTLLRFIAKSAGSKGRSNGTVRFSGMKIIYNDAKALMGMYNEIYYQGHYAFVPKSEKPVIIDCGANIGLSVLYFNKIAPNAQIIAIEADPEIAGILRKNLEANNCNAKIIAKAAWTSNDEILSFGRAGADAGSIFATENVTQVQTMRLKDLLDRFDAIELLKMDIEGAEIDVINDCGASLAKADKIFVEFHSFPGKPQRLEELLGIMAENGFRYSILPARREEQPFLHTRKNRQMDVQLNIFFFKA